MFSDGDNGSAQSNEPYKHYFIEISKQLQDIRSSNGADRYSKVSEMLRNAKDEYSRINDTGIDIEDKVPSFLNLQQQQIYSHVIKVGESKNGI